MVEAAAGKSLLEKRLNQNSKPDFVINRKSPTSLSITLPLCQARSSHHVRLPPRSLSLAPRLAHFRLVAPPPLAPPPAILLLPQVLDELPLMARL